MAFFPYITSTSDIKLLHLLKEIIAAKFLHRGLWLPEIIPSLTPLTLHGDYQYASSQFLRHVNSTGPFSSLKSSGTIPCTCLSELASVSYMSKFTSTVPFNSIRQGVWPVTNLTKLRIRQVWLWPVTCKKIRQLVSNFYYTTIIYTQKYSQSLDDFVRRTCDLGQVWHFVKSGGPVTCDLSNWIKWYSNDHASLVIRVIHCIAARHPAEAGQCERADVGYCLSGPGVSFNSMRF